MSNDAFIEDVVAAIYERYDMDRVKNVFIHADGGKWIGKLGALMPNAVFVMDGFHLKKYLKKLFTLEGAGHYAGAVKKALKSNNLEAFVKYCDAINEKQDSKGRKTLCELVNYFTNNWDSIVERMSGEHIGSCTEGLVSHLLSERISRTPLAWSKEGLGKMAMLRIFTQNGGKVTAEHIRVSRSKTERTKDHNAIKNGLEIYGKYAEKQANEALGECHDWSIFENVCQGSIMSGKLTGTSFILKAIAKMRPIGSVA